MPTPDPETHSDTYTVTVTGPDGERPASHHIQRLIAADLGNARLFSVTVNPEGASSHASTPPAGRCGNNAASAEENVVLAFIRRRDASAPRDSLPPRMEASRIIDALDAHRAARPRSLPPSTVALAAMVAGDIVSGDSERLCHLIDSGQITEALAYLDDSPADPAAAAVADAIRNETR